MTRRQAALVLVFLLPLIPLSKLVRLGGVSGVPPRVAFTAANVWSGQFQEWFEAHFARHFGAFAPLVKLDAALDNALGETRFNSGLCGLRGHHGVLFQQDEIEFMNKTTFDEAEIARRVRALAAAAAKLRAIGVPMKILFIPTKTSYYPAEVPARWRLPVSSPGGAVVERTLAALRAEGLDVVDTRPLLAEVERRTGARAYPREGRHFTDYTSCTLLAGQPCPVGDSRPARGAEDDLYRCFNEIGVVHRPERLVDTSLTQMTGAARRPLFVGSSFMRELENEARRLSAFDDLHLFYYNQADYVGERISPIPTAAEFGEFMRARDLVLIDFFAPQVEQLGHGFADRVNTEL